MRYNPARSGWSDQITKGMSMAFLDIVRPKWKSSDSAVRRAAVEQLTDQASLEWIAETDSDQIVRGVAKSGPRGIVHFCGS